MTSSLRVLPLGGLGEIGKNMMVVEYEDRIVVVDTGLRFPTADMLGIDLVLPDFAYLRERAEDIEAILSSTPDDAQHRFGPVTCIPSTPTTAVIATCVLLVYTHRGNLARLITTDR